MRRAIVWNPGAGSARGIEIDDLVERLRADGAAVVVEQVGDGRDPVACARAALAGGADVVVAAGGDGTVSAVAGVVAGTGARLGVLPLGTANSFAGGLGIPAELDGAIATVQAGAIRTIDAAWVRCEGDARLMILHCMIGLHAEAVGGASKEAKQRFGTLAYVAAAARELGDLEPFALELEVRDQRIRCEAIQVAIANLAPARTVFAQGPARIEPDDGLVDVTIVAAGSFAAALAATLHLYRSARQGEPARRDDIGYVSCPRVTVTTTPAQTVLVDGEQVGQTPVTVEIRAGALTVLAPPPPPARDDPRGVKLAGLPGLEVERA